MFSIAGRKLFKVAYVFNSYKRRFKKIQEAKMEVNRLPPRRFTHFNDLHEDLMMNVLSYIADVPHELSPHSRPRSSVTGVLPLVCKQFNEFCKADFFWKSALERLRRKDPYLWEEGLLRVMPQGTRAVDAFSGVNYKFLFLRIFNEYIRVRFPVFYMAARVRIGHSFGLHFFEPRYRLLIQDVMAGWPEEARHGEPIEARNGRFPTFIYAHMTPLAPTTPACLVQVRQCVIHQDFSADVMLVPVSYVWLEMIWERPNSGHMFEATAIRMGREQARQMENQGNHPFVRLRELTENADDESNEALQEYLRTLMAQPEINQLWGERDNEDD